MSPAMEEFYAKAKYYILSYHEGRNECDRTVSMQKYKDKIVNLLWNTRFV